MRVLVVGGSGGLGTAICRELARRGDRVAAGYHRHPEPVRALQQELAPASAQLLPVALDVSDSVRTDEDLRHVASELGGLDAIVNAAAVNVDGALDSLSAEDCMRMYAVNVLGTMNAVRSALPYLLARGQGRIVNFSSVLATRSIAGVSAYAGTKAAIEGLTRALAVELGPKGITVNAIAPGFIDAGLGARPVQAMRQGLRTWIPLRRPGAAAEVATVVRFLLSAEASYVNGSVIPIDGGLLAGGRLAPESLSPLREEVVPR